jgi:opacity protein-like surface antigen
MLSMCTAISSAQSPESSPYYARRNTFGVFGAYSGDSSHMLLGSAENRRLLQFGVSYSRRLLLNQTVNVQYNAEFLPVVFESDPEGIDVVTQTSPVAATYTYNVGPPITCTPSTIKYFYTDPSTNTYYSETSTISCQGRRWVVGEAMSPVGFQFNLRPRHKTQPFLIGHGGYMYSTQPVPINEAGSFNFTFDLGIGVELFRTKTRSIRAEYRYHHISNHNTSNSNPGIDNGLVQVTYSFGR